MENEVYSFRKTLLKGAKHVVLLFVIGGLSALASTDLSEFLAGHPYMIGALPVIYGALNSAINFWKNVDKGLGYYGS